MNNLKFPMVLAILLTVSLQIIQITQVLAENEEKGKDEQKTATSANAKEDKDSAKLIIVKTQTLSKKTELKGAYQPVVFDEITLRPEVWATFKIEKIVPHGSQVKKGDVLIQFDTHDIDEKITELKVMLESKNLAFRQAVEEYNVFEELFPQEQEVAERNLAYLKEDREYEKKISYPLQDETLEFRKKSANNQVAYAEEELKQLLKMYSEDGLTEETEEIVLKRTRDGYEQAVFSKKLTDESLKKSSDVSIPRQRLSDEKEYIQKELELTKNIKMLPLKMAQKKLEMYKMEKDGKDTQEELQKHLKDKELFTIKAPADGYVYYGEIQNGLMTNASTYAKLFVKDSSPPLKKTILTVFNNNKLQIHGSVDESEILGLKAGLSASMVPKVDSTRTLQGKVVAVSEVPDADGKFGIIIETDDQQNLANLYAAMTCQCTINVKEHKDVLALPKTAVHENEKKEKYVYVKNGENFEKKTVKVGDEINNQWVITEGLKAGDVVSPDGEKQ